MSGSMQSGPVSYFNIFVSRYSSVSFKVFINNESIDKMKK